MASKKVTQQQILNAIGYYFDWATKYMQAASKEDKEMMAKLEAEWNPEQVIADTKKTPPK
jgi:hypothetical protein